MEKYASLIDFNNSVERKVGMESRAKRSPPLLVLAE
jgi:hypothetical protein